MYHTMNLINMLCGLVFLVSLALIIQYDKRRKSSVAAMDRYIKQNESVAEKYRVAAEKIEATSPEMAKVMFSLQYHHGSIARLQRSILILTAK